MERLEEEEEEKEEQEEQQQQQQPKHNMEPPPAPLRRPRRIQKNQKTDSRLVQQLSFTPSSASSKKQPEDALLRYQKHSDGSLDESTQSPNSKRVNARVAKSAANSNRNELATLEGRKAVNNINAPVNCCVDRLRKIVRTCVRSHHVAAALFYADKLISLSPEEPRDALLFADACYQNRDYHRSIHALKKYNLLSPLALSELSVVSLKSYLLLVRCMLAIKQREECLDVLTRVLPEDEKLILRAASAFRPRISNQSPVPEQLMDEEEEYDSESLEDQINPIASLCLLMGETLETIGNRESALHFFRLALRCDVRCTEAFQHIFEKQMLSPKEEKELLNSLDWSSCGDLEFLQSFYSCRLGKYEPFPSTEDKFALLEDTFGLKDNLEMIISKAESYYYQHDLEKAHELCEWVREQDPFNSQIIPVYVATLVEFGKKRELYHYAHQIVDVYPKKAAAWYTVGCYYLLIRKYEAAQRYFHKATTLEPKFAPAWIGFGNSFAAQDESDQAMCSYRTASTLFPGCHLPPLFMGMEHLRTNNLTQASEFLKQALAICSSDPLVFNELGVVAFKQKRFSQAIESFTKALELCSHLPDRLMETWEPTFFNLGYCYRKLRRFDEAIHYFQRALRLSPRKAATHAALGFTCHMKGDLELAIESYHSALAYNSEDTLAGEMIQVAFEESMNSSRPVDSLDGEDVVMMTTSPAATSRQRVTSEVPYSAFGVQSRDQQVPGRVAAGVQRGNSQGVSGIIGGGPNSGSGFGLEADAPVRRTLTLDDSFSSIEPSLTASMTAPGGVSAEASFFSSLEFSDASSMNLDD